MWFRAQPTGLEPCDPPSDNRTKKQRLIDEAEALGVDTAGLTVKQLEKAIAEAE